MSAAALLALFLALGADPAADLLFRARHAERVEGDPRKAAELYGKALAIPGLAEARRTEARVRLALCHEALGEAQEALAQIPESLTADPALPERLRSEALACRARILASQRPQSDPPRPPASETTAAAALVARANRVRELLAEARRLKEAGEEMRALLRARAALELEPASAEAETLVRELEARLSEAARFVRDALRVVKNWSEARVKVVASRARETLREGMTAARRGEINTAEARFREALRAIDECEFAAESEELLALRQRVAHEWRLLVQQKGGRAEIPEPAAASRSALMAEFLNLLQRMLDVASSGETEYRILPVEAPEPARPTGAQRKPEEYQLRRDEPSAWTPALFARHWLPARVEPESWRSAGAFLDAAGSMLVARNRREVLDAAARELAGIASPDPGPLRARFLLVPVDRDALERIERHFLAFSVSTLGPSPVLYRVLPADRPFEYVVGYLRDQGCDVSLSSDVFTVEMANGAPQTLLVSRPSPPPAGFEGAKEAGRSSVLLDLYPLRDRRGRTAAALRLACTAPSAPAMAREGALLPRLLSQEAALYTELPPGAVLLVGNLVDPFRGDADPGAPGRSLLLVFENPAPATSAAEPGPDEPAPPGASLLELPLHSLLVRVRDDPGPSIDRQRGFLPRPAPDALRARAEFLATLLRDGLATEQVLVDPVDAVARVPSALHETASAVLQTLERESERAYEVRVTVRAVRTSALERWLAREPLALVPFGEGAAAVLDVPSGEALLRGLPAEPADLFAPEGELAAFGALGLQERHALSSRARTLPAAEGLATEPSQLVTEGIRVAVRPYAWRGRIRCEIVIEACAATETAEERSLEQPVPALRTATEGFRLAGGVDLGAAPGVRTVFIRGLGHPRSSAPDRPVELVAAVSISAPPASEGGR